MARGPVATPGGSLAYYFRFHQRQTTLATEVRAGLTTFMVMAYIIFVNPIILGYVGVPGLEGKGLLRAAADRGAGSVEQRPTGLRKLPSFRANP